MNDFKIFMISGLGADKRAFEYLDLDSISKVTHIEWINPLKHESLESYTNRLTDQYMIDTGSIIIGLSFGGIIGVEIAKRIELQKLILISSAGNRYDLPNYYRFAGKLGLGKLIHKKAFKKSNSFLNNRFGVRSDTEKKILDEVIRETNPDFAKWAINQIMNWREKNTNQKIIRIHGNNDRIIPLKNKVDYIIEGGTHFMIVQNAGEISGILNKEI